MIKHRLLALATLATVLAFVAIIPRAASQQAQNTEDSIPAFHDGPPKGELPATLSPMLFGNVAVQNAYTLAGRVKKILYQQPCYCHCDRSVGHASLLDCFASKHGSGCDVCMKEAIYSYEQTRKGKTAAQIRAGIEQGEWRQVDMSKYETPVAAH
jgi:hypothetical protein